MAFCADGRVIGASSEDGTVHLWDVTSGKRLHVLASPEKLTTLFQRMSQMAFSPDGTILASEGPDNTIMLWQVSNGKFITRLVAHTDGFICLTFSADSRMLASGSGDGTIKLWEVASRAEKATFKKAVSDKKGGYVACLAFSPDGRVLASGSSDPEIKLWSTADGKNFGTLRGHVGEASHLAFSPDGKTLASGDAMGACKLWDVASRTNRATLLWNADHGVKTPSPPGPVLALAFSADGSMLARGSSDGLIYLQNPKDERTVAILRGHSAFITSLSFSADGKTLASGSFDMTARLWDVPTGKTTHTIFEPEWLVQLSPDGKILATVQFMGEMLGRDVKLRNVATAKVRTTLTGVGRGADEATSLVFSPNGQTLAVVNNEHGVTLWDVATGVKKASLAGRCPSAGIGSIGSGISFSPDGKTLANGTDDGTVRLWNMTAGKQPVTLKVHAAAILGVAFGQDGKTLAAATAGNSIVLWDLARNKKLTTLPGQKEEITSLSFNRQCTLLATGSQDGIVKLWNIPAPDKPDK
jgi:WD40 repeat protein